MRDRIWGGGDQPEGDDQNRKVTHYSAPKASKILISDSLLGKNRHVLTFLRRQRRRQKISPRKQPRNTQNTIFEYFDKLPTLDFRKLICDPTPVHPPQIVPCQKQIIHVLIILRSDTDSEISFIVLCNLNFQQIFVQKYRAKSQ